jgi:hypothetical protein
MLKHAEDIKLNTMPRIIVHCQKLAAGAATSEVQAARSSPVLSWLTPHTQGVAMF